MGRGLGRLLTDGEERTPQTGKSYSLCSHGVRLKSREIRLKYPISFTRLDTFSYVLFLLLDWRIVLADIPFFVLIARLQREPD